LELLETCDLPQTWHFVDEELRGEPQSLHITMTNRHYTIR